jgi:O-antigen biosynthesis protein
MIPEWFKACYRAARARTLSIGLRAGGVYSLTDAERRASEEISVVVAVHEGLEVASRCLNSLRLFGGGAEVVVVDDGSKQNEVRRLLDDHCSRNQWKLVRHEAALGHSRASEAGMLVATKPYACLLNSDTVITPCSWLGIVRAFTIDPKIAVSGPSTSHAFGPQCLRQALHCRHYWNDEQVWCFAERYVARNQQESVVDLPMVGGFAFFVRRTVWNEMNGFDKNLPDYGNETEFCRRVIKAGLRVVWSRASYIHHLGSESYGRTLGAAEIRKRCLDSRAYIKKIA